ncbi:lebercilin-like protein isoform X1 [Paroedura picta]|uniref:lebercilin-like protein isoform X1 n=1 Tax=Paroedura picta TaxID=143630 RepID=UPI0010158ED5
MYSNNGITASDDCFLRFIVQEGDECERHTRNESLSDSHNRIYKGTQSSSRNKVNNCSKHTSQCGSGCFQLDHSHDFDDNASRRASSNSSSCSEQDNCGSTQKCYCEDFHTDSSGSVSSASSRSSSSHLDQPENQNEELPKEKKENSHQAKGGKKQPKKKQQQKTFACYSVVNSQKKNNVARRILSARLHKVKELKNEVCVLKNELEASNMENQLLKSLQFRHLKAIAKYENAETNLPDLLERHSREVRTLRVLLRKSQEQERNASRKLREVEIQLLKTKDAFQALQKLCEDKHLAERGELRHRLTALTERMEASDKKIQGLEKRLLLNNTSFSHQIAAEKKKTVEAQMITVNLQMEIKSLNQRIKEKERELGIRNIYANRLLKSKQDKCELESPPKDNISKAIQADRSFKAEAMTPLQKRETEKSEVLKEGKIIQDPKEKLCDVQEETALKSESHQIEKLSKEDMSDVICKELLREEICPKEEKLFRCDYLEGQKKRRDMQGLKVDILKDELEKLMEGSSFQPTQEVLKNQNNLEEALVEKKNNEECKEGGEKTAKEIDHDKLAAQRHKTSKLKKQYVFSEVIENLHQGLPSSGPIPNTSIFYSSRQVSRQQTEIKGNSVNTYEPSFGNSTKTRQDTSTYSEGYTPTVSAEKKNTLMEELFGPSCILQDSNQNLKEMGKGKKTLQSEKIYEISYLNDGLQCGDCKQTQIKVFHTTTTLEDPR